jgi:hypothetical protein
MMCRIVRQNEQHLVTALVGDRDWMTGLPARFQQTDAALPRMREDCASRFDRRVVFLRHFNAPPCAIWHSYDAIAAKVLNQTLVKFGLKPPFARHYV